MGSRWGWRRWHFLQDAHCIQELHSRISFKTFIQEAQVWMGSARILLDSGVLEEYSRRWASSTEGVGLVVLKTLG